MATPAEVLEHFARFRAEGGIDRARAAGEALRAFASLSSDEKRDLAVLVAGKAAPELVPRIREQTGVELSGEQIEVVLEMVRNLDAEDVEDLRRTVTDPEAREAALRSTAEAAAAAAVTAAGLDDDLDDLPPPPPHLLEESGDGDLAQADDGLAAADAALADAERRRQEIEERAERELAAAEAELATVRSADEPEEIIAGLGRPAEPWGPSDDDGPAPPPAPYVPVFEDRELPDLAAGDESGAGVGPPRALLLGDMPGSRAPRGPATSALAERIRAAGTDGARLALLTAAIDEVLSLESDQVTGVLLAIPDGWARRRAVERLLEHDAVLAREVPDTVRLLGRASDRTWAAATAVEARLLELDQLDDLLDARAAARLRRRYG